MNRGSSQPRGKSRTTTRPTPRDLQVLWANVARGDPHDVVLNAGFSAGMDVLCIQEPWTGAGTKTKTHNAYDLYAPIPSWDKTGPGEHLAERPRVLTYVRKGSGLRTEQRQLMGSRDMLWIDVNGYSILNIYRDKNLDDVMDYVTHLTPTAKCLVGGDFNCQHEMFEPDADTPLRRGTELAEWTTTSGMDFIGTPGEPTHKHGHVLDLTFSNISYARTLVREDLQSGSDHSTQVTTLPGRGRVPLEQCHYKVSDKDLLKFAGLIQNGIVNLPNPATLTEHDQINIAAQNLTALFEAATRTAGKVNTGKGKTATWWTPECQDAYRNHLASRPQYQRGIHTEITEQTRLFLSIVRKSKRAYWKKVLDDVKDDQSLYRVIGWHKLQPRLKSPPLKVGDKVIENTLEKAETLYTGVLDRFSAEDDLEDDPLEDWDEAATAHLPWNRSVTFEEVERNVIGVTSTSPGIDKVTVRLLKASWPSVGQYIQSLYSACLQNNYFPSCWKVAEVAMLPKVGPGKDKSSVRSWRPIALLSCISKGLERIIARRIAWTALTKGLLSPQHGGALPKRSCMDLVAAFVADVEQAFASGMSVTMVTMDVQGAFDALLRRRLLARMIKQGWPRDLLELIDSFLSERKVRVRLESATTGDHTAQCGTPQGSPLSPILYLLYLAELLNQDPELRFGYADDICLYRGSKSLDTNVEQIAEDVQSILQWGAENKIFFAPEKLEMIHLSRRRTLYNPPCVVNDELTIEPVPVQGEKAWLRWLGVFFDRKLTFRKHVTKRAQKARGVSRHIKGLARVVDGPPASSLRKAVITCVLPSILYGNEAWYGGRHKPMRKKTSSGHKHVSARLGGHIKIVDSVISLGARGALPIWRTTPTHAVFRDAGLPSGAAALEEAKIRFAMRLQTVDEHHPLVRRIEPPMITRGKGANSRMRIKTKVQVLGHLLPSVPRPKLKAPHFSPGCRTDPTGGMKKKAASEAFKKWWPTLPPGDISVFSDGSEQYIEGVRYVGYGYAIYQNGQQLATGKGSINNLSHVFDAEAIGAWRGLTKALTLPSHISQNRVWLCIDSTSVIWGIRGDASTSSQWAFHNIQEAMEIHDIRTKWSPGHTDIEGNEAADKQANDGALLPQWDAGLASEPTVSGIRTLARKQVSQAQATWWGIASRKLSRWYNGWKLPYTIKELPELSLPRPILHRLLAIRTNHGDFSWYHNKFHHVDAKLVCACKRSKTPDHLVLCNRTQRRFNRWPKGSRPRLPPTSRKEGMAFLRDLCAAPLDFASFLSTTEFYSKYCTTG